MMILCHIVSKRRKFTKNIFKEQSLKGAIPVLQEAVSVKQFIKEHAEAPGVKLIAYCGEQEKVTLAQAVKEAVGMATVNNDFSGKPALAILIGPEGDFSPAEVDAAIAAGFRPLTLGSSRLRTETAAVAAVAGVYFMCG